MDYNDFFAKIKMFCICVCDIDTFHFYFVYSCVHSNNQPTRSLTLDNFSKHVGEFFLLDRPGQSVCEAGKHDFVVQN